MPSGKSYFIKITNQKERDQIFESLVNSEIPVEIFDEENQQVMVKAQGLTDDALLFKGNFESKKEIKAVFSFFYGRDRYFFHFRFSPEEKHFRVPRSIPFFRLQRRNHFRVMVEEKFQLFAKIQILGKQDVSLRWQITDLSVGGAGLLIKDKNLKDVIDPGSAISGVLDMQDQGQILFKGEIVHLTAANNLGWRKVGVQFLGLSPGMEQQLFGVVMGLHRQQFSRWSE